LFQQDCVSFFYLNAGVFGAAMVEEEEAGEAVDTE
jgi:hypothetical protein